MMNKTAFLRNAEKYRTIPLQRKFFLDTITPIQLFQQLQSEAVFLLESRDPQSPWSRYSFVGLNPYGYLREANGQFEFQDALANTVLCENDFHSAFSQTMAYLNVCPPETSVPFYGGAVGCIGYDAVTLFEDVDKHDNDDLGFDNVSFLYCETVLALDHESNELQLFHHVRLQDAESVSRKIEAFDNASREIDELITKIDGIPEQKQNLFFYGNEEEHPHREWEDIRSNYRKANFMRDVKQIKSEIGKGYISQAVLSQRFEVDLAVSGLEIYRALRVINPSPYLFYLKINGVEVVGSSPERLVQVNQEAVEIHPIAGTRKRGQSEAEDQTLARELLADEKERAEHFMLVDTAREDVSKIAKPGTVKTPVLTEVGRFSHVMHLISKVRGKLAADREPIDALLAAFPAGTVSGSPKVTAMNILQKMEPTARNLYAGAIGYLGFDGNIDACIAIRTLVVKEGTAYIQAGAGIVADSQPLAEWQETRNKAKALIRAIEAAEEIFAATKEDQLHA